MKKKVEFTVLVKRTIEIDLKHYQNMQGMADCKTIEEAVQFDIECIKEDPFMFINHKDTKIEVEYRILNNKEKKLEKMKECTGFGNPDGRNGVCIDCSVDNVELFSKCFCKKFKNIKSKKTKTK